MSIELEKGIIIMFVGIAIVFLGLIILYLVFENIVPYFLSIGKKKVLPKVNTSASSAPNFRTGEEITAIAAAVHLFLEEVHDEENAILTIGLSSKNYSPWSSKIYATHNLAKK